LFFVLFMARKHKDLMTARAVNRFKWCVAANRMNQRGSFVRIAAGISRFRSRAAQDSICYTREIWWKAIAFRWCDRALRVIANACLWPHRRHEEIMSMSVAIKAEIRKLEDQRFQAMIDGDFDTLEKLLGDHLVYTHSTSQSDNRAASAKRACSSI
jgi:hypothetical protein